MPTASDRDSLNCLSACVTSDIKQQGQQQHIWVNDHKPGMIVRNNSQPKRTQLFRKKVEGNSIKRPKKER